MNMGTSETGKKILERLERKAGVPGLLDALTERLSPSELTSLMLEVYRRQAQKRTPAQVLADYEQDRFVCPSRVDVRRLLEWERVALSSLPDGFEPVKLAPVCPLGTSSVVAGVDQNWAVATSRNSEVVSDATNVLALEVASRRRQLSRNDPRSSQAVRHPRRQGQHQFDEAQAAQDRMTGQFGILDPVLSVDGKHCPGRCQGLTARHWNLNHGLQDGVSHASDYVIARR
jgi:hypothetical protein